MLYGIGVQEISQAILQISLAVMGSASFFGLYFLSKKDESKENLVIARRLLSLFSGAFFVFLIDAFFVYLLIPGGFVFAHEGIAVKRTTLLISEGRAMVTPFILALVAFNALLLSFRKKLRNDSFLRFFFLVNLLLTAFILFFFNYTGEFGAKQLFVGLHGIHSIWTLGAATLVDYIYLRSLNESDPYQKATYLSFPVITKFIWAGLLLDTVSAMGVFGEYAFFGDRVLFLQTVYAILIINAVFLTRRIGDELTAQARKVGRVRINPRLSLGAIVFGSISIVSWYTLTLVDYFEHMTLSFDILLSVYLLFIAVAIAFGYIFELKAKMR